MKNLFVFVFLMVVSGMAAAGGRTFCPQDGAPCFTVAKGMKLVQVPQFWPKHEIVRIDRSRVLGPWEKLPKPPVTPECDKNALVVSPLTCPD